MKVEEKSLKEVSKYLLLQAQSGVTYKNIKRGLINKGFSEGLSNKLIRILEIEHKNFK